MTILKNIIIVSLLLIVAGGCQTATVNKTVKKTATKSKVESVVKKYVISVNAAPNNVEAFGFEVLFDPKLLKFEKFDRKDFTLKGYNFFGMNVISPGRLRIGGISSGSATITKNISGDLAELYFKKTGKGEPEFSIIELKDHMNGWASQYCKKGEKKSAAIIIQEQI